MPGLIQDPRYGQALQRRKFMRPEVAAVPGQGDIIGAYAQERGKGLLAGEAQDRALTVADFNIGRAEARNVLSARNIANRELSTQGRLADMRSGLALSRRKDEVARGQVQPARWLAAGGAGLSAIEGFQKKKAAEKRTGQVDNMRQTMIASGKTEFLPFLDIVDALGTWGVE